MKRKTKQTLKMVALGVVGLGAVVGAVSVLGNLRSEDDGLKTIHPTFEVGGLKETDGKFEETSKSIYTKNAFECQGLEIELDFDNTIDYQVFYYESDGDFIEASGVINGNQDLEVPLMATHARLEITPNWAKMGEDYKDTKNQEIKWYEVAKYSTQLDIKVNENQDVLANFDVAVIDEIYHNKNIDVNGVVANGLPYDVDTSKEIKLNGKSNVQVILKEQADEYFILIKDFDNGALSDDYAITLTISEDFTYANGYYYYTFELEDVTSVRFFTSSNVMSCGVYYNLV